MVGPATAVTRKLPSFIHESAVILPSMPPNARGPNADADADADPEAESALAGRRSSLAAMANPASFCSGSVYHSLYMSTRFMAARPSTPPWSAAKSLYLKFS